MDAFSTPEEVLSFASLILLLLFNTHQALEVSTSTMEEEELCTDVHFSDASSDHFSNDNDALFRAALHHWRMWSSLAFLEEDLGFWVKPRSTTWFSKFLLQEYEESRWITIFRMTKLSFLSLATMLTPTIQRRNTKYRDAVPVTVRVGCAIFKLTQGASLLICNEIFAIGRSTVSIVLREVVHAINVVLRNKISWPSGDRITSIATDFQRVCGLPAVVGAIDDTHFAISKPKFAPADYFYFKTGGYSMQCQAVVDSSKRFLDVHVGMPGSTNDSRVLRRSAFYHRGQHNTLWEGRPSFHGYSPYLLGDSGFPLLPWLMVPQRQQRDLTVAERLFNRKLSRGRAIVENVFGVLKQTFRELHRKTDLHVTFFPDVVIACTILHNVLLQQSHEDVEILLEVLLNEGLQDHCNAATVEVPDSEAAEDKIIEGSCELKRQELGVFLTLQRIIPT